MFRNRIVTTAFLGMLVCSPALMPAQDTSTADKTFVRKASMGSMAEVKLSQLALQKSSNDDVKKFAQKMVDDHTMLIDKMKPVADSMGVKPPAKLAPMAETEYTKLSSLSGAAFDKEYLAYMQKDHHKDLQEFTEEESKTSNQTLKATVTEGKQVIQQHTEMVDQLASANGAAKSNM